MRLPHAVQLLLVYYMYMYTHAVRYMYIVHCMIVCLFQFFFSSSLYRQAQNDQEKIRNQLQTINDAVCLERLSVIVSLYNICVFLL